MLDLSVWEEDCRLDTETRYDLERKRDCLECGGTWERPGWAGIQWDGLEEDIF